MQPTKSIRYIVTHIRPRRSGPWSHLRRPSQDSAGTVITVVGASLGSKTIQATVSATVATPVSVNGRCDSCVIRYWSTVVEAKAKGKVKGRLTKLALKYVTINGQKYPIATSMSNTTEKGKGKRTAVATGGGAAGGALIGGIAGGGKGAAIGAAVGAGAGFVGGTLTGNNQIELPAESALSFELTAPLTLK